MTRLQEERLKRDTEIVKALKKGDLSYFEIAVQHRVCIEVVNRVAKQNGLQRGPGGRKLAVANA